MGIEISADSRPSVRPAERRRSRPLLQSQRLPHRIARRLLGLAFAAAIVPALTSSPSLARLDDLCRRDAARYDALLSFKRATTPERVAEVYVEAFTTKGADRETQAVWRRMLADGVSAEQAMQTHLDRYMADAPAAERAELEAEISANVDAMALIHELVLAFEGAEITPALTAEIMADSWRAQRWSAPRPIEHYVTLLEDKADGYLASGLDPEQAALRAAVETRAALDRDRGAPRSAIVDKGSACYKDALNKFEIWLRHQALERAMGPLTPAEAADVADNTPFNPNRLSRLSYYTHVRFGPRDYSLDRLRAWEMAAGN